MINFRVPAWVLLLGVAINVFFLFFNLLIIDVLGVFISVFCIACFIFTYKLNKWERNEKEKDDKGSSLR